MSNNTAKTRSTKTTAKNTEEIFGNSENNADNNGGLNSKQDAKTQFNRIVPREVDPNQLIVVRNGFQGRMTYTSPRTGETFVWSEFGDEQMIELRELRNAKNAYKKFFVNNWFMFDDESYWVIDYLGVGQYYRNALTVDGFDDIFKKPASEIEGAIALLSNGQKKSVSYRAKQLIADGTIDSNKVISALESSLGVELVERF